MRPHINGIDWLRTFMSLAVVAWHTKVAGYSLIFHRAGYTRHSFVFSDFINFHILLMAVPVFILISCLLFALKVPTLTDLKNQLIKLFLLLTFWTIILSIWSNGIFAFIKSMPEDASGFFYFIISANGTIYYFFVCLILSTVITFIAQKFSIRTNSILFIVATAFLFILPYLTKQMMLFRLSAYWNPLNFLPYPFAAILISRSIKDLHTNYLYLFLGVLPLFIAGVLLGFFEWHFYTNSIFFPGQGYAIPAYTRTSIFFISIVILTLATYPKIPNNRVVKFMSKHSLGLYCLHPFVMMFNFSPNKVINFIVVVVISYAMSLLLPKFIRQELLR